MLSGGRVTLLELHFPASLLWPVSGGWAGGETIKKLMELSVCIHQDGVRKTEPTPV